MYTYAIASTMMSTKFSDTYLAANHAHVCQARYLSMSSATRPVPLMLEVGGDVRRLPGVTRIVEQVEQAGQVVNFCDYAAAFDSAVACIYTRRSRLLTDTDSVCSCTVT